MQNGGTEQRNALLRVTELISETTGIQLLAVKILNVHTELLLLSITWEPDRNADSQHHTYPKLTDPQSVLKHYAIVPEIFIAGKNFKS